MPAAWVWGWAPKGAQGTLWKRWSLEQDRPQGFFGEEGGGGLWAQTVAREGELAHLTMQKR